MQFCRLYKDDFVMFNYSPKPYLDAATRDWLWKYKYIACLGNFFFNIQQHSAPGSVVPFAMFVICSLSFTSAHSLNGSWLGLGLVLWGMSSSTTAPPPSIRWLLATGMLWASKTNCSKSWPQHILRNVLQERPKTKMALFPCSRSYLFFLTSKSRPA